MLLQLSAHQMLLLGAAAWLGLRVFDGLSTARFQRLVILVAIVGAAFLLVRQL